MKKNAPKSKVTRITVAALFSLGNYEHIRYEIGSEVPRGGSAKQTLHDTLNILQGLKPVKKPYELSSALKAIEKPESERSEYEKDHMKEFREIVKEYEAAKSLRAKALQKLDDVGGTSVKTDAKNNWDDSDIPF